MNAHDRILEGIEAAVKRHWRFTKDLFHVKPEYLFTVSIADALSEGFDGINWRDLHIKLEEPTRGVTLHTAGTKRFFAKTGDPLHVDREGKVDIHVIHDGSPDQDSWIVEVKGFDPSWSEFRKDILRLSQFLLRGGKFRPCKQCFLGFPTQINQTERIKQELRAVDGVDKCQTEVHSKYVVTNEDPEDGIPAFYANCIVISRIGSGGTNGGTAANKNPNS